MRVGVAAGLRDAGRLGGEGGWSWVGRIDCGFGLSLRGRSSRNGMWRLHDHTERGAGLRSGSARLLDRLYCLLVLACWLARAERELQSLRWLSKPDGVSSVHPASKDLARMDCILGRLHRHQGWAARPDSLLMLQESKHWEAAQYIVEGW